jgi:tetratricopeptide (TPR) repeat protein
MKASSFALFLLLMGSLCLRAEELATQVTRAAQLNSDGEFRAALQVIESVTGAERLASGPVDPIIGVAWNVRGLALQNLGNSAQARRSYETAVHMLRNAPALEGQYAAALDNLGSLESDAGHLAESRALRLRAKDVYSAAGSHAGVARILNNLALLAIAQRDWKEARHDLADAFEEENLMPNPNKDDLAAFFAALCLVNEREGNNRAALTAIARALDLWTEVHGSHYYLLADGYSLRANAERAQHDYSCAMDDLRHALALMREHGQDRSRAFALTETLYAGVLRDAGSREEAANVETAARTALANADRGSCHACTVSAESLR